MTAGHAAPGPGLDATASQALANKDWNRKPALNRFVDAVIHDEWAIGERAYITAK